MPDNPTANPAATRHLFDELLREFSARLVSVFETMAGEKPGLELDTAAEPPADLSSALLPSTLLWKQPFSGLTGAAWLASAEAAWTAAGTHILLAAGLGPEDTDPESIRSSYLETLSQALGGLAQNLSSRARREVTPVNGKEDSTFPAGSTVQWGSLTLALGGVSAIIFFAIDHALLESLVTAGSSGEHNASLSAAAGQTTPGQTMPGQSLTLGNGVGGDTNDTAVAAAGKSKTFDLLLDVELPVSVSFGSAEVSLKDVLKLTTGSIIELNRTIQEPVEVVVNNCVIARGEVVVVEGNFGVRIQSVATRQERLRTLR